MERKFVRLSKQLVSVILVLAVLFISSVGAFAENGLPQGHLNINTADVEQLAALPGIGNSKAEAIVKYRSEYGPFPTVDSLANVKGIGTKILEKIRPLISTVNQ